MAVPISDKLTSTKKKLEYYSDFTMGFEQNPITNRLAKITNEQAVASGLKNLILTNQGERPFNPLFGSRVKRLLFEPVNDTTASLISDSIKQTIRSFENRIILLQVKVSPDEDNNSYNVTIVYALINNQNHPLVLNVSLTRVR